MPRMKLPSGNCLEFEDGPVAAAFLYRYEELVEAGQRVHRQQRVHRNRNRNRASLLSAHGSPVSPEERRYRHNDPPQNGQIFGVFADLVLVQADRIRQGRTEAAERVNTRLIQIV